MQTDRTKDLWRGQVRLPQPLVDWLKDRANENYRSMNAELVDLIAGAKRSAHKENAPAVPAAEAPI